MLEGKLQQVSKETLIRYFEMNHLQTKGQLKIQGQFARP